MFAVLTRNATPASPARLPPQQGYAHPEDGEPGTHSRHSREQQGSLATRYGEGTHSVLTWRQQAFLTSQLGGPNRIAGGMPRVAAERRAGNAARRESGSGSGVAVSTVAQ